jgi:hypothetical protein
MSTPAAAPEWLPKAAAARRLGVSPRQIERHIAAGRLRSRRESRLPHQTAAPVYVSVEDLAAIESGAPHYHPMVEQPPAEAAAPKPNALARQLPPAEPVSMLRFFTPDPPPAPRPWLTLDEAEAFSGLPVSWLRRAAAEGRVDAINVALRGRPRWRIRRAALEGPLLSGD